MSPINLHASLVAYFRQWQHPAANALADETLQRVAATIEDGDVPAGFTIARYSFVVARAVLIENLHPWASAVQCHGATRALVVRTL